MNKKYKPQYHVHGKDKLLKRCPFCGGKATLRSPIKLRSSRSFICSDISCNKCSIWSSDYSPLDNDNNILSRSVQDALCIEAWNRRTV